MAKKFLSGINVTGTSTLNTVANAGTDTDKFLVLDASGNVDFRTGAELLSDVNAVPVSRTITINGTTYDLSANRIWTITAGGGGGGASVSYYLNGSVNQGTIGGVTYYEMNKVPVIGAGTDFSIGTDGYIASFLTDANNPALLEIPAGNWNFETYFSASSGGGSPTFYIELYKYNGTTFTLIASNSASPKLINDSTSIEAYFSALAVPQTTLTLTDRLAIRIYVTHSGRTITLHTENGHLCQVITTFTTGLTALNGLTAQVQYFQTGTSGTDFNISSTTATHIFNLPVASATNTGKLSSTDWSAFNDKVPNTRTLTINGTTYDLSADRSWTVSANQNARTEYEFTTNGSTTTYSATYTVGQVDVFYNGSKLSSAEFTATNGTSVTLAFTPPSGQVVEIVAWETGGGVSNSRTLTINGVAYDLSANRSWTIDNASLGAQPQLNGTGLVRMSGTTVSYDNATYATQSYVTTAVANLVNSAPATLDTLNELATALGNDANFATTITTSISTKQNALNGTGFVKISGTTISYDNSTYLTTSAASSTYLPLTGGTLTGALSGTSADFSGLITGGGTIRATGATGGLSTGSGVEIRNNSGTGEVFTYNRTSSAYLPLRIDGSTLSLNTITSGAITLGGAISGTSATFTSNVTALGNSNVSSAIIANNGLGGSGTAQYYQDFGNGSGFLAGRILRGNGASGYEANGLNIDSFQGLQIKLNALGGSGGTFNILGGSVNIGTTTSATYGTLMIVQNSVSAPSFVRGLQIVHPNGTGATGGYISMSNLGSNLGGIQVGTDALVGSLILNPAGGNIGIGVVPSAWSLGTTLQIGSTYGTINYSGTSAILGIVNAYYNGSSYLRQNTGSAFSLEYNISAGNTLVWRMAPDGSSGTSITLDPVMSLKNNGNLLIGTTTDNGSRLQVSGSATFSSSVKINQTASEIQQIINSNAATKASVTQYQVGNSSGWEVGMGSVNESYSYIFSYGTFGTSTAKLTLTNAGNMTLGGTTGSLRLGTNTSDFATLLYSGGATYLRNDWASTNAFLDLLANSVGFRVQGTGNATLTGTLTQGVSDKRFKKNIEIIPNALEKINLINGYTFEYDLENEDLTYIPKEGRDIGVIAQEIEQIIPEAVSLAPIDRNEDNESKSGKNYLTVNYEKIIPLLIQSIKEQQAQIQELKAEIDELENK